MLRGVTLVLFWIFQLGLGSYAPPSNGSNDLISESNLKLLKEFADMHDLDCRSHDPPLSDEALGDILSHSYRLGKYLAKNESNLTEKEFQSQEMKQNFVGKMIRRGLGLAKRIGRRIVSIGKEVFSESRDNIFSEDEPLSDEKQNFWKLPLIGLRFVRRAIRRIRGRDEPLTNAQLDKFFDSQDFKELDIDLKNVQPVDLEQDRIAKLLVQAADALRQNSWRRFEYDAKLKRHETEKFMTLVVKSVRWLQKRLKEEKVLENKAFPIGVLPINAEACNATLSVMEAVKELLPEDEKLEDQFINNRFIMRQAPCYYSRSTMSGFNRGTSFCERRPRYTRYLHRAYCCRATNVWPTLLKRGNQLRCAC